MGCSGRRARATQGLSGLNLERDSERVLHVFGHLPLPNEMRLSCERGARGRKGLRRSQLTASEGGQTERFLIWSRSAA